MSMSILFWIVYIICFIFGGLGYNREVSNRWAYGHGLALWLLIGLLGWRVFGSPIQ